MKNNGYLPFAERLLTLVQAHEIALRMALSEPAAKASPLLRKAINSVLDFEAAYGSRAFSADEKMQNSEYAQQSAAAAQAVIMALVLCQDELRGAPWDAILSQPGMAQNAFDDAAYCHAHRHMQQELTADNGKVEVSVELARNWAIYLEFRRGPAKYYVSKSVFPGNVGSADIKKQLKKLQQFNDAVQAFINEAAHEERHWPAVKTVLEMEKEQVTAILDRLFSPLTPDEKKLLQKHSSELSQQVKAW